MRPAAILTAVLLLAAATAFARPAPFAVVELFTSEGCSSCPPADRLLARIADEAAHSGQPVYALAFHVGYWDRLEWSDRFADPAFSRRQERYAAALGMPAVYTPEMIVNGRASFVGSDERRAIAGGVPQGVLEGR
jgi:hypothetical protein